MANHVVFSDVTGKQWVTISSPGAFLNRISLGLKLNTSVVLEHPSLNKIVSAIETIVQSFESFVLGIYNKFFVSGI